MGSDEAQYFTLWNANATADMDGLYALEQDLLPTPRFTHAETVTKFLVRDVALLEQEAVSESVIFGLLDGFLSASHLVVASLLVSVE
jgi:hypothetical protein